MKNYYSISIPKPCHEDWTQMSPREKGKFCSSCSKTVIDFTKMETYQIQDFIAEHKNKRICGHFKQTQLDSINIHIPSRVLEQQQSFHKLFLLVLLIVMGSTLLNCTNKYGDKQKIDSIEVIDSINNKTIDVLGGIPKISKTNTIAKVSTCQTESNIKVIDSMIVNGGLTIETTGDIEVIAPIPTDSIKVLERPVDGLIDIVVGIVIPEENLDRPISCGIVEVLPEFKNTPNNLSKKEKRDYLSKTISNIVSNNFNTPVCLELKGKQKVQTIFIIDSLGFVQNIRARAPHPKLEEEAKRVLKLIPQLVPAKQDGKNVSVSYALPIVFQTEE